MEKLSQDNVIVKAIQYSNDDYDYSRELKIIEDF